MNTRQRKKRQKEVLRRLEFFKNHIILSGRTNGKTQFENIIWKAIWSKKYRPFKQLEMRYREIYVGVDIGKGKDLTAICHSRIKNGIRYILKIDFE